MRVSNISKFLGGADNVNAVELIRGEQIIYTGTVRSQDGTALDITSYTISAVAEFYTADVTVTAGRSGDTLTIEDLTASTKADMNLTVAKLTPFGNGRFTLTIPQNLAADSETSAIDTTEGVFVAVIYITYNDGLTIPTIRKSRLLAIVRHSA